MDPEAYAFKPLIFTEVGDIFDGPVVQRPEKRSGHRVVCDDANMYSFGGYLRTESFGSIQHRLLEELWCFNFAENRWKLLPTTGDAPQELASHCALLYGNYLHVFGGTGVAFGESTSNKLSRCDLRTLDWEEVPTTGDIPDPQYGQALILDEEKRQLYLVGGTTGFSFTIDVHRLDLTTKHWTRLYAHKGDVTGPSPRYRHEIGYDGSNIYVFGGGTNVEAYELDTVPVFNLETKEWSSLETKNAEGRTANELLLEDDSDEISLDGFPVSRRCHASVQIGEDIYISGGVDDDEVYDDVWKFNIPKGEWLLLPDKIPSPLAFHSASATSEGCMYIFGGVTDTINSRRTNKAYKMWLKIPKLKEICWEAMLHYNKKIRTTPSEALVEMGIPFEFAKRAHPAPPGGKANAEVESTWESDYLKMQKGLLKQ